MNNNNNNLLDYVTEYANNLKVHKSDVLYMILTGSIPAYTGHIELSRVHNLWLHTSVRKQLKKIAAAEHMSANALIWNTVTGKHAPLKLTPPECKARPVAVMSVYAPVAAWVSKVVHELNISQPSLVSQCLRDNKCFAHICVWPELTGCKKYSTISVDRELYNHVKATRIKGQSLAYTVYKMLEVSQKPAAPEVPAQAAAATVEDQLVQSPVQDPVIMLTDLRARCRELLLELMEQEFERIKKTITRI